MLRNCDNERNQLIIRVFFYEGLRLGELCRLSKGDIDFTRGKMLIHGKGEKQRIIPLHKELASDLRSYIELDPSKKTVFQLSPRMTRDVVRNCAFKAGFYCYPHLLRHSFAAHLYKNTKNIWLVSKMLGHSKLETTVKYLRSLDVIDDFSGEYQNAFVGTLS